jgi:hypothetical protein
LGRTFDKLRSMPHIFISYAREDQTIAKGLADLLDSEGFEVWWDTEIYVGQSFPDLIVDAISGSRHVILLWSSYSIESEWVLREARLAKKYCKLLPVLLPGIKSHDLPSDFRIAPTRSKHLSRSCAARRVGLWW